MGAGKTTAADLLVERHGYTRLSLAEPLRQLVTRLLGRPIEKRLDRGLLQRTAGAARSPAWAHVAEGPAATEALARHLFEAPDDAQIERLRGILHDDGFAAGWGQPLYWLQRWQDAYHRANHPVVVDDCRFGLEAEFMRDLGFRVVRLDVPLEERQRRIIGRDGAWNPAWSSDPTEAEAATIPADGVVAGVGDAHAIAEATYAAANP